MPTPAEIIAARVSEAEVVDNASDGHTIEEDVETSKPKNGSSKASTPSIGDESAFPVLGGKKGSTSETVSRGSSSRMSNFSEREPVKTSASLAKAKPTTIQEAFSLNIEDQLNVTRSEFIKILNSVRTDTQTNIECTTSLHTRKRTFLITGRPQDVKMGKRLIIKKLTKPVIITFQIPSKLRAKVIGPQGNTLKPILSAYSVKINLDQSPQQEVSDDDIFSSFINVKIEGDVESCQSAKKEILEIVEEETKNLNVKIPISAEVKPFASKALGIVAEKYPALQISIPSYKSQSNYISVSGAREPVLDSRNSIVEILEKIPSVLTIEEVSIPQVKHRFLPIEDILKEFDVLIQLPKEGGLNVQFIGEKNKIRDAKESARKTTSQYKVEILDMGKSHGGMILHAKNIAALFIENGTFASIAKDTGTIIIPPSRKYLENSDVNAVPIEIVFKGSENENLKNARKSIVAAVNKIPPSSTKVIKDINRVMLKNLPSEVAEEASKVGISYVVLNLEVVLFATGGVESEEEDFVSESTFGEALDKVDEKLNILREKNADVSEEVLHVESSKQGRISGPRGTTLKLIISHVDNGKAELYLHSNSKGSSPDELYICGLKREVEVIKQEVVKILKDEDLYSEKGGYNSSVDVPKSILARLIGKNGSNLSAWSEEYGVKIDVNHDISQEASTPTDKVEVFIRGPKLNVEACKGIIALTLKKWADETTRRIQIEETFHKKLIGPNGINIKRLKSKYNVRIWFPSSDLAESEFSSSPRSKDEIVVRGSSRSVSNAVEELKDLYKYEKENSYSELIKIPIKAISRVIGKSGETINDIAERYGVEYHFHRNDKTEEERGYTELELIGSRQGLKEAISTINGIIEEIENHVVERLVIDPKYYRDLIGPNGSILKSIIEKAGGLDVPRARYMKLLSIPYEGSGLTEIVSEGNKDIVEKIIKQVKEIVALKESSITVEYELPKDKHRFIVGPLGSIRHSLQDEYGVHMDIPRPSDSSSMIKLSGVPEKVESLIERIKSLTKDNWAVSIDIPEGLHALVAERGAIFKKIQNDFDVEVQHGNNTRRASKLSNEPIPSVPESAFPKEGENKKFTVVPLVNSNLSDKVIPWRFVGEDDKARRASELVKERLEKAKNATSIGWFFVEDLSVFNKIIGFQGTKINQIRNESGAFITVPRGKKENSNFIFLVGTEDNLQKARDLISSVF